MPSQAVVLSSGGALYLVDAATGQVRAERNTGPIVGYLRAGPDLLLFCDRIVQDAHHLSLDAYAGRGLGHLWFAAGPLRDVFDATATEQSCLVCLRRYAREGEAPAEPLRGAFRREVLVFGRRTGAALGALPTAEFEPALLTQFVPAPHHLLATVQCVVDKVPGQRLVAFGTGKGEAPVEPPRGDDLLAALREGRISPRERIALAERHARRAAYDEVFDALAGGLADPKVSGPDYLGLGRAMASLRHQALAARRPEIAVEPIANGQPAFLVLDEARDFDPAPLAAADRWRGPADLSATIQLAYTPGALAIHAVVRDDVHCPGAPGRGDRLEVILARWLFANGPRRGWSDSDIGLGLAADGKAEPWVWLGRVPDDLRQAIRLFANSARRDEAQRTTTYQLLIPWRVIGEFAPNAGATVDFAIAIHDDDGKGPKGSMRWGLFEPGLLGHLRLKGD